MKKNRQSLLSYALVLGMYLIATTAAQHIKFVAHGSFIYKLEIKNLQGRTYSITVYPYLKLNDSALLHEAMRSSFGGSPLVKDFRKYRYLAGNDFNNNLPNRSGYKIQNDSHF
ncbi:hypothetical protein ACFFRR_005883 [Megaselia abdita]